MKKILPLLTFVIIILSIHAQIPESLNYQAVARNNAGAPLANSSVAVRISIRDVSVSGTVLYSERDTATTNAFGLFACKIGNGNVISGTFATINWASGSKFMQVELDPTGGSSYADMGTTQLVSVPYALHAKTAHIADTVLNLPAPPPPPVALWDTAGNNIYKTNSGNVGIGTSAPAYPLEISSATNAGLLKLTSTVSSTQITMDDSGPNDVYLSSTLGQFDIWTGGNNRRLSVATNGNVGIGTATPTYQLEISSANTSGLLKLTSTVSSTQITMDDSGPDDVYLSSTLGQFDIWTGGNNRRLSVATNGNVGIGTASPAFQLQLATSGGGHINLGDQNGWTALGLANSNGGPYNMVANGGTYLSFLYAANESTVPTSKMLMDGTSNTFRPTGDNIMSLGANGSRWTAVWAVNGTIQTSDSRYKKNIRDLSYGLKEVMQLRPVSYEWKNDNLKLGTGNNLGFVAQELESIVPDVVIHSAVEKDAETGKYPSDYADAYGVKYAEFIPVLTKAIQQQQQLIEKMQKEIDALKNK